MVILHYLGWTRSTRVSKTPRLGTFRNAENGCEVDKSDSWSQKNPVRDSVAFWYLPDCKELGKWVRQPPLANQKGRLRMCSEAAAQPAADLLGGPQKTIFFSAHEIWLAGQDVPLLNTNCLTNAHNCGEHSWL